MVQVGESQASIVVLAVPHKWLMAVIVVIMIMGQLVETAVVALAKMALEAEAVVIIFHQLML